MKFLLALGMPGPTELLIILGILLLVFGGNRIPELARGLGEGIQNFKQAMDNPDEAGKQNTDSQPDITTESSGKTS